MNVAEVNLKRWIAVVTLTIIGFAIAARIKTDRNPEFFAESVQTICREIGLPENSAVGFFLDVDYKPIRRGIELLDNSGIHSFKIMNDPNEKLDLKLSVKFWNSKGLHIEALVGPNVKNRSAFLCTEVVPIETVLPIGFWNRYWDNHVSDE